MCYNAFMTKTDTNTQKETLPIYILEEKGDVEHAIRCTEQALNRAQSPWLKTACSYRLQLLRAKLARQRAV